MQVRVVTVVLILSAAMAAQGTELTWNTVSVSGSVPAGRLLPTLVYDGTNNRLVLFGGSASDGSYYGDTWVFDIGSSTWTEITSTAGTAPSSRRDTTAGEDRRNTRMVICCGQGDDGLLNDLWALSFDATITNMAWTELSPTGDIPSVRYGQAGGIYPNAEYMYVSHGFGDRRYSDTYRLDLSSLVWVKRRGDVSENNPWVPHSRCLVGTTMVGADEIVMYGGCASIGGTAGPCPGADGWVYTDRTASWRQMDICPTPRRWAAMAPLYGETDLVVMYGGKDKAGNVLSALEYQARQLDILNTRTGEWTLRKVADNGQVPERRQGAKLITANNNDMYMFGGEPLSGTVYDTALYRLTGTYTDSDEIAGCPGFLSIPMIHAFCMFLAWGFFLQIGSLMARYFKHRDPYWFHMHRRFQVMGLVFSGVGFIAGFVSLYWIGVKRVQDHFYFTHGIIGLVVVILGFLQPLNAFVRPHKGVWWRPLWEFVHKGCGRIALLLGLINITLGLFVIQSPLRIWTLWLVLLTLYFIAHIVLSQQKYGLLTHVTALPSPPNLASIGMQTDLEELKGLQDHGDDGSTAAEEAEAGGEVEASGLMRFFKRNKKHA